MLQLPDTVGDWAGAGIELGPRLRRWTGYLPSITPEKPIDLGRGIKATVHSEDKKVKIIPGDYWIFAIRDREYNKRFFPQKSSPDGVRVYRYPLAIIKQKSKDRPEKIIDCREFNKPLNSL